MPPSRFRRGVVDDGMSFSPCFGARVLREPICPWIAACRWNNGGFRRASRLGPLQEALDSLVFSTGHQLEPYCSSDFLGPHSSRPMSWMPRRHCCFRSPAAEPTPGRCPDSGGRLAPSHQPAQAPFLLRRPGTALGAAGLNGLRQLNAAPCSSLTSPSSERIPCNAHA